MKTPVIFVAVSLAAAILVLASLLVLTRADSDAAKLHGNAALNTPKPYPSQPLWKMKNAPAAIKAKPTA